MFWEKKSNIGTVDEVPVTQASADTDDLQKDMAQVKAQEIPEETPEKPVSSAPDTPPVPEPASMPPVENRHPAEPGPLPAPEKPKHGKNRVIVHRNSFSVHASLVILLFALVFTVLGIKGHIGDTNYLYVQVMLPLAASVLFFVLVPALGERALWTTVLPVLACIVFFAYRVLVSEDAAIEKAGFMVAYSLAGMLYCITVFGGIKAKPALIAALALPLTYKVFIEDMQVGEAAGFAKLTAQGEAYFCASMQELSTLCLILSLLFLVFAMHMRQRETGIDGARGKLTPIKGPKVHHAGDTPMAPNDRP